MTVKKYFCPHHEESTPSAVAYANGYYSFCCGRSGPLSELGLKPGERIETVYIEDLASSLQSIRSLPKQNIRGFALHADDRGYFIIFDNDSYYKRRIYGADSGNKYRGPSGHTKPWFYARREGHARLALVEGEFNAMSLAALELPIDVFSPGGSGDFYSGMGRKNLKECLHYETIHIIVDNDAAGAQAAIEGKSFLVANGHNDVRIHLLDRDFNDTHTEQGLEVLREQAKGMGL